jgi:hypothetical protein
MSALPSGFAGPEVTVALPRVSTATGRTTAKA